MSVSIRLVLRAIVQVKRAPKQGWTGQNAGPADVLSTSDGQCRRLPRENTDAAI